MMYKKTITIMFLMLVVTMGFSSIVISEQPVDDIHYKGILSGYVKDKIGVPIDQALITVSFHGTCVEGFSDIDGFYHITNIPICRCLKNVTVVKTGYVSVTVWLHIDNSSWYDFVLKEKLVMESFII